MQLRLRITQSIAVIILMTSISSSYAQIQDAAEHVDERSRLLNMQLVLPTKPVMSLLLYLRMRCMAAFSKYIQ